ncbi:hypothetical protein [Mycolicibacterium sp. A43C]
MVVIIATVLIQLVVRLGPSTGADEVGPLPVGKEPQSALLPQLEFGPGAELVESKPGTWELWSVTSNYATTVNQLRSKLPIGRPFEGLSWCSERVQSVVRETFTVDDTTWRWGGSPDLLSLSVTPAGKDNTHSEITINREPDAVGCVK